MVSKDSISGYFLEGSEGEFLMVIKSHNEELMLSIIKKISSMRDDEVKKLAEVLENHFYERDNYRGHSGETRPQNKTKSPVGNRGRNRKAGNTKP
jgi:hypothetical protein